MDTAPEAPSRATRTPTGTPSLVDEIRSAPSAAADDTVLPIDGREEPDDEVISRELMASWRVSRGQSGEPSNGPASDVAMSSDGRYVVFSSAAGNLAAGDDNGYDDVFLFDSATGITRLISANGEDMAADGWSRGVAISADGRFVAFYSWANDLVESDINAVQDVFLWDRASGSIERVSIGSGGEQANDRSGDSRPGSRPAISADGRVIAFHSQATNLVDEDTNRAQDVFVYDRSAQAMARVSISSDREEGDGDSMDPALSADGRYVVFASRAGNLDPDRPSGEGISQIFVHDRSTGDTKLVSAGLDGSAGNRDSLSPVISGDGTTVVFSSNADNLVDGDTNRSSDIFIHDKLTGGLERVSVNSTGAQGDGDSTSPVISLDGRYVSYASAARNLVHGDHNSAVDIFIYDRLTRHTGRASIGVTGPWSGVEGNADAVGRPALSVGGRLVTYVSHATNLEASLANAAAYPGENAPHVAEVYALERVDLPMHTVRGRVLDGKNRPASGVTVRAGPHRAVTGEDGRFVLEHVTDGTYTLTPEKEEYSFVPARRTVSVFGDLRGLDFLGLTNGSAKLAFLSLPFADSLSAGAFLQALRDTEDGGWVDAWFDHDAPDKSKNGVVQLWDGRARRKDPFNEVLGCYERRCYDGHDGTDFPYRDPNPATDAYEPLLIYPAAPGTVAAIVDECEAGDRWCNRGYGNEVVLVHDRGFFTRYSHLASVGGGEPLRLGLSVSEEDVLGTMGSTGNSFGVHLHFAVHQDDGNSRWDGEEQDLPVDPFGWAGEGTDPWAGYAFGPVSRWMWLEHPTVERLVFGSHGATLRDLAGAITVTVPAGALTGQVRLELDPGTPAEPPKDAMRSLGRTVRLRLLEWYAPGEQTATVAELEDAALGLPIDISVDVAKVNTLHLDMERAQVHRWDDASRQWQALPTLMSADGTHVQADSGRLGIFDLQAPLLCAGDSLEPDDAYYAATYIEPGGAPLRRLFDLEEDEDWLRFDAQAGQGVLVRVDEISDDVTLLVELYDLDGLTALAAAESVDGRAVQLVWSPPDEGTYFVRVAPTADSVTGCGAAYSIALD